MKPRRAEPWARAASPAEFPPEGPPELALLGRSNVGKSSLLNRLAGRRELARTSGTPGKTREIRFYRLEGREGPLVLVDLPGYGWARVSKAERASWQRLVEAYLGTRRTLRVAVLLLDVRRDFGPDERGLLDWLEERGVPSLLVCTKVDKLKPMQRARRLRELAEQASLPAERLLATSATRGLGLRELWRALDVAVSGSAPARSR